MNLVELKEKYNRFLLIKNIFSIVLYIITTIIWINTKTANNVLKVIAIITLLAYISLFVFLLVTSKHNLLKNLKRYREITKFTRSLLKLLNIVIIFVSTTSLFAPENVLISLVNIILIIFNLIIFIIKMMIKLAMLSIKKIIGHHKKKFDYEEKLFSFEDDDNDSECEDKE